MLLKSNVEFIKAPRFNVTLKVKKMLTDCVEMKEIKLPWNEKGNVGMDFYAPQKYIIQPHTFGNKIPTGIAVELPENIGMLLLPRSSYGVKTTLRLSNSVGLIDTNYRGEICALFDNLGDEPQIIEKGERFCQGVLIPAYKITMKEVSNLQETQRGDGGFGSTGRK